MGDEEKKTGEVPAAKGKKSIEELEQEILNLRSQVTDLETKQAGGVDGPTGLQNMTRVIKEMVAEVLGPKFKFEILGFGKYATLEIQVPEEFAAPGTQLDKDGRGPRFPKDHPKAGEPCGDIRHCRIADEIQVKKYLELVKNEITSRFGKDNKSIDFGI